MQCCATGGHFQIQGVPIPNLVPTWEMKSRSSRGSGGVGICVRMPQKKHREYTIWNNLPPFFWAKCGPKSWYLLALWNSSDTYKINCGNRYQLFSSLPGQPFKRKWDFGDTWWKIPSRQRGIWTKTMFLTLFWVDLRVNDIHFLESSEITDRQNFEKGAWRRLTKTTPRGTAEIGVVPTWKTN